MLRPDQGTPLFASDATARCSLGKAAVKAAVLEAAAGPVSKEDRADLEAACEYTCASPAALRTLDIGLFDTYKHTQTGLAAVENMGHAWGTAQTARIKVQ